MLRRHVAVQTAQYFAAWCGTAPELPLPCYCPCRSTHFSQFSSNFVFPDLKWAGRRLDWGTDSHLTSWRFLLGHENEQWIRIRGEEEQCWQLWDWCPGLCPRRPTEPEGKRGLIPLNSSLGSFWRCEPMPWLLQRPFRHMLFALK